MIITFGSSEANATYLRRTGFIAWPGGRVDWEHESPQADASGDEGGG